MIADTPAILDHFAKKPNAQIIKSGDEKSIYIPGTRKDRVLLVAHADTVFDEKDGRVPMNKDNVGLYYTRKNKNTDMESIKWTIESDNNNHGIGADDRAGCAMLELLKNTGHSLLICNQEEKGCIASKALAKDDIWSKILNDHQFAIEFDRCNNNDMAFYEVGSDEFKDWCEANFHGYKRVHGSVTDICQICDPDNEEVVPNPMCGMNISIGYYRQHSSNEYLNIDEFITTLETVQKVLTQENIPAFRYDRNEKYNHYNLHNYRYNGYGYNDSDHELLLRTGAGQHGINTNVANEWSDRLFRQATGRRSQSISKQGRHHLQDNIINSLQKDSNITTQIIRCLHCGMIQDIDELQDNNCIRCNKVFY